MSESMAILILLGSFFVMILDVYKRQQYIEVRLFSQIRPEKKFHTMEELKAQIEKDKEQAQAYWTGSLAPV